MTLLFLIFIGPKPAYRLKPPLVMFVRYPIFNPPLATATATQFVFVFKSEMRATSRSEPKRYEF